MRTSIPQRLALLLLTLGTVVLVYALAVRPWMLAWGATPAERATTLAGDGIVPDAASTTTRAIAIAALPSQVFPWVAQLGQNRAGFYSFELLEDLVGAEMPRAEALLPGAQEWKPGDELRMYPYDKLPGTGGAPLVDFVPGRALAFATQVPGRRADAPPDGSWAFVVEPAAAGTTRLLVRTRSAASPTLGGRIFERAVFEPMHFAMERRMMEGIARLAEGKNVRGRAADAFEILVWTAMLGLFFWGVGATLRRERWLVPLALTGFAAVGFLVATLFQPPALLGVPLRTYVIGTFFGIIPGTFAFASAGAGLDGVIASAKAEYAECVAAHGASACRLTIGLANLINTQTKIAFVLLGIVALIPVLLKTRSNRHANA